MSEKEAKHIKHYYCQRCKEEDPTLQTVFRAIPAAVPGITAEDRKLKRQKDRNREKERGPASSSKSSKERCGQCAPCRTPNCGTCDGCQLRKSGTGKKYRCERRHCANPPARTDGSSAGAGATSSDTGATNAAAAAYALGPPNSASSHKKHKSAGTAKPKKRRRSVSPAARVVPINPELEGPRQCHGPGCRMTARPQSKYCSDECG